MKLVLLTTKRLEQRTIGQLYINGDFFSFTLEDPIREPEDRPDTGLDAWVASWKLVNETAIPSGSYEVTLENSPKFGPDTMTINKVPGFATIRIHAGNTQMDTEGCVIVGYKLTADDIIWPGSARPAVADLKQKVKDAIGNGEDVTISISRKGMNT